jgi:hypothetical protein
MLLSSSPGSRLELELPSTAQHGGLAGLDTAAGSGSVAQQLVLVPEPQVLQLQERLRQLSAAASNTQGEAEYQVGCWGGGGHRQHGISC